MASSLPALHQNSCRRRYHRGAGCGLGGYRGMSGEAICTVQPQGSSMSVFELSFDAGTVSLDLGEPLSSVRPKLSGLPHDIGEFDVDFDCRYVTMAELGVVLLFEPDRL